MNAKLWWLRLYTIPDCKKLFSMCAIAMVGRTFLHIFAPQIMGLGPLLLMLPVYTYFKLNQGGFAVNIEFHKMNVPYRKLQKALLMDTLIQTSVFLLGFWLSLCLPYWMLSQTPEYIFDDIAGTYSLNFLWILAGFLCAFQARLSKLAVNYWMINLKDMFWLWRIGFTGLMVMSFFILLIISQYGVIPFITPFSLLYIMVLSVAITSPVYMLRAIFHQEKNKGSIKRFLFYQCFSMPSSVLIVLLLSPLASWEIRNSNLPVQDRLVTFGFWGTGKENLDVETVRSLLTEASHVDAYKIFKNAAPEVFQVPVETLLTKNAHKFYGSFLYGHKATPHNLMYIAQEMNSKEMKKLHPNYQNELNQLIVHNWPKGTPVPEWLTVKVVSKSQRVMASEKKVETGIPVSP